MFFSKSCVVPLATFALGCSLMCYHRLLEALADICHQVSQHDLVTCLKRDSRVMSFSKAAVKRKVGDEHRRFQEKWDMQYLFVEHRGTTMFLICREMTCQGICKILGDKRANRLANLQTCLLRQQDFFKTSRVLQQSKLVTPEWDDY